jgi:hypothetical protein
VCGGHYTDAFGSYKVGGVGGLETAGPGLLWRLRSVGYFPFIYLFSFFSFFRLFISIRQFVLLLLLLLFVV